MPLTNAEIDAAVPAAGTPNRALTNAALKEAVVDIAAKADPRPIVRLSGGSVPVSKAVYENAIVFIDSGTQILSAPGSGTDVFSFDGVNLSSTAATIGGLSVAQNEMFFAVVDGTNMYVRIGF